MQSANACQVQAADSGLDFPLSWDLIEDLFRADQVHDLRTGLDLHNGELRTLRIPGGRIQNSLWQSGFLQRHSFLVNDQQGYLLGVRLDLFLLFRLALLQFLSPEIQGDGDADQYHQQNNEHDHVFRNHNSEHKKQILPGTKRSETDAWNGLR